MACAASRYSSCWAPMTSVPGFADGGGGAGVTLFFVLSGYLITSLLLVEETRSGRVDLRAFYVRRALRLFPALAAVLIVVSALAIGGLMPQSASQGVDYRIVLVGVVCYVANWVAVAGQSIGMLGHTWSLAVEEQFYIVWPMLLLATLRLGRQRLAFLVLLLVFLDTPYRFLLDVNGGPMHVFVGTETRGDALMLGCVLALLQTRWRPEIGWMGLIGVGALAATWPGNPALGAQVMFIPTAAVVSTIAVAGCPAILGLAAAGLHRKDQLWPVSVARVGDLVALALAGGCPAVGWDCVHLVLRP